MKTALLFEQDLIDLIAKASVRWARSLVEGKPEDILAASQEITEFVAALSAHGVVAEEKQLNEVRTACKSLLRAANGGDALCSALYDMTARREAASTYGPSGEIRRKKDSRVEGVSA